MVSFFLHIFTAWPLDVSLLLLRRGKVWTIMKWLIPLLKHFSSKLVLNLKKIWIFLIFWYSWLQVGGSQLIQLPGGSAGQNGNNIIMMVPGAGTGPRIPLPGHSLIFACFLSFILASFHSFIRSSFSIYLIHPFLLSFILSFMKLI